MKIFGWALDYNEQLNKENINITITIDHSALLFSIL